MPRHGAAKLGDAEPQSQIVIVIGRN